METLVTYLVAAMVAWIPLYAQHAEESPEQAHARYESIARDVAAVALDENETPLFGSGAASRAETALLMLSVASFESSYRKSVDDGIGRGDGGRSYCLMQVSVGDGFTREGWSGRELIADRTRCFRAALHVLQRSFGMCHSYPLEDRLSAYATGRCMLDVRVSRSRVERAKQWWSIHAVPRPGES